MTDARLGAEPAANPAEDDALPASSAPNIVHLDRATVTLHPKVSMELGIAALSAIKQGGSKAEIEGRLGQVYVNLGIASWTFVDAQGQPEDITPDSIARLLPFADGGLEVAEAADALYSRVVMRPLVKRRAAFLAASQTDQSTSATSDGGSTPRKPSPSPSSGGSVKSPEP